MFRFVRTSLLALGMVAVPAASTAPDALTAWVGGGIGSQGYVKLPPDRSTILFGESSGIGIDYCGRAPAPAHPYSVALYSNGRLIERGDGASFPVKHHPSAATVKRLVHRARVDGFFRMPTFRRDVQCRFASTQYVRIQANGLSHTVEVYGFLPSYHPALYDLLQALSRATLGCCP